MNKINIFWFRRDLRLNDNTALSKSLLNNAKTLPIFIYDENITNELDKDDARISFIYNQLNKIHNSLNKDYNSQLLILKGKPKDIINDLTVKYNIESVFTNDDYEPYAKKRDEKIENLLNSKGIRFKKFKDHVIFEKDEITKDDKSPYIVYTPYMKKWKSALNINLFEGNKLNNNFFKIENYEFKSLKYFGFTESKITIPYFDISENLIDNYNSKRNFPSINGTSKIGPHLRFGTISIREVVKKSLKSDETYLNELIWREFFMQIMWFFPHTSTRCFRPKYDNIKWLNDTELFKKWCQGKTGYPIVDAGMRELNQTGFMHNRVRMITASFLCKHLLIDWRWGEAYFAKKLNDYELSSNVGNWQWAAGTGCDAAPYFRIFNPTTQAQKFDKENNYINKWVKELNNFDYCSPIIDHKFARQRCLETYKSSLT